MSTNIDALRDIAANHGWPVCDEAADEIEDLEKAYALLFAENAKWRALAEAHHQPEGDQPLNYEQLTARQALEIANLKAETADLKERLNEISMILCCIGGPLNDNVLGYSAEQRKPLHRINDLAEVD